MTTEASLKETYVAYAAINGAEVGFPTSLFLASLCDELKPSVVFDLGSGWTSYLLRKLCPLSEVWSLDTDVKWLNRTVAFCSENGVADDGRFVSWDDDLLVSYTGKAQLVVHDAGDRHFRMRVLSRALDLVAPGGIIVLDDMHKGDLREFVVTALRARPEFVLEDTRDKTFDEATRYAWVARRAL